MSTPAGREAAKPAVPWQRLSGRIVWIDAAVSLASLTPGAFAIYVLGVHPSSGVVWPLGIIAVVGVVGGAGDIVRWAFTSYRMTGTDVERRTGLFTKEHRTVPRDRVRSVDSTAKLRHRLAGLRVLTVGAGQQAGAGESALVLDALTTRDAEALLKSLLSTHAASCAETGAATASPDAEGFEIIATLRPWWVFYNMFTLWAFLMGAGLLWGGFWLASSFGVDVVGAVSHLIDREQLGWVGITVLALLGGGVFGALGLGVTFLLGFWGFELGRVRSGGRSHLRTRRGLLSTREVSRDESRMRGMSIAEPLVWRWMGVADTHIITTGLNVWDPEEPSAILPRGPISVARTVSGRVLGSDAPFDAPLKRHPRSALHRRLWWATLLSAAGAVVLTLLAVRGVVPGWLPWIVAGIWPATLLAAGISYGALGHTLVGPYVVVRSGLLSRSTTALRRDAVSTIAVRQSVLQRRLGLCTVSAMTAAGWSAYEAFDVSATEAVPFAHDLTGGVLEEFLESTPRLERG